MKCFLDDNDAIDTFDFETDHNTELVPIPLCGEHFKEWETTRYQFEEKYFSDIKDEVWERLRSQADGLGDIL